MMFKIQGKDLYINHHIASCLDTLVYNIDKDWDFMVIVSGDRMVRVGKSLIAQTILAYLSYRLKKRFDDSNMYFSAKEMLNDALKKPKNSIFVYDEARESLASSKVYTWLQNMMLDFFAEAGQLNHIFVIVLNDFFDLTEMIAIARSEFLVNVYRKDIKKEVDIYGEGKIPVVEFKRGQCEIYNRYEKQLLYEMAKSKKRKFYGLVNPTLSALDYKLQYPIDEQAYREKKRKYLERFKERHKESTDKCSIIRDKLIEELTQEGLKSVEIRNVLKERFKYFITDRQIRTIVNINHAKNNILLANEALEGSAEVNHSSTYPNQEMEENREDEGYE